MIHTQKLHYDLIVDYYIIKLIILIKVALNILFKVCFNWLALKRKI